MGTNFKRFFQVIKKEYPPWMFSKSCNFLQMIFGWDQRKENSNITKNSRRSDILTLLTLLGADEGSKVQPKYKYTISRYYIFPNGSVWFTQNLLYLWDVWKVWSYVNANVCFCLFDIQQWSVLSYRLLSPSQKFIPEEIQLSVNCYVSILNFHSPKY